MYFQRKGVFLLHLPTLFFFLSLLLEFLFPRVLSWSLIISFNSTLLFFHECSMFFCFSKDINYGFFDLISCSLHNLHFFLIHVFLRKNEWKLPLDVSDSWLCVHIKKYTTRRPPLLSVWIWQGYWISFILGHSIASTSFSAIDPSM